MNTKKIQEAAKNYAKEQLGEGQFKSNKDAVKAISEDFTAGANWIKERLENLEESTVRNMENEIVKNQELSFKTKLDLLFLLRNEDVPVTDGVKKILALLGFDLCCNENDDEPIWYIVEGDNDEYEEKRAEHNMNVVSNFIEHYKQESGQVIPEEYVLSFFNA